MSFSIRKQIERYFNTLPRIRSRSIRVAYHTFFRSWFYSTFEIKDKYTLTKRAKIEFREIPKVVEKPILPLPQVQTVSSVEQIARGDTKWPVCGSIMRKSSIKRHLINVHGMNAEDASSIVMTGQVANPEARSNPGPDQIEYQQTETKTESPNEIISAAEQTYFTQEDIPVSAKSDQLAWDTCNTICNDIFELIVHKKEWEPGQQVQTLEQNQKGDENTIQESHDKSESISDDDSEQCNTD